MKQFNAKMDAAARKFSRDRRDRVMDARVVANADKSGFESYLKQLNPKPKP